LTTDLQPLPPILDAVDRIERLRWRRKDMNMATPICMRTALVLAAAGAAASLAVPAAFAHSDRADAAKGARQVPRGAAVATGPNGPIATPVVPEFAQPVSPDGAALRSAFDELAAQAASTRQASNGQASEIESSSSGFSWRDAGVGGGMMLLLVAMAGLAWTASTHGWRKPVRT
jgi:hypothetical protein